MRTRMRNRNLPPEIFAFKPADGCPHGRVYIADEDWMVLKLGNRDRLGPIFLFSRPVEVNFAAGRPEVCVAQRWA